MSRLDEVGISAAILGSYHDRLRAALRSDVIIVGAGPSGMMAALHLARGGAAVTVLEKRLAPGGGIWGGGMAMSQVVVQDEMRPLLDDLGVAHKPWRDELNTLDAIELGAALAVKAIRAGAAIFNLMTVEDVCVHRQRVTGVVVNRSMLGEALPIDPITFAARAVIDSTGHEAAVAQALRRRGLLAETGAAGRPRGEGPMDAAAGEAFVVDNASEVFPGLWVTGMSVCAVLSGPRMGPIFGGMLRSGVRVAELVERQLATSPPS